MATIDSELLHVVLLVLNLLVVPSCSGANDGTQFLTSYDLHNMMESTLLNNSQTMYDIQRNLFRHRGYTLNNQYNFMFLRNACLTVDNLHCPLDDAAKSKSYHKCWDFQWTDSVLVDLISGEIIRELDPLSGLVSKIFVRSTKKTSLLNFHLHLNKLPCLLEKVTLEEELVNLLTWLKVYAKTGVQKPGQFDPKEKGFISLLHGDALYSSEEEFSQHTFRIAIITTYMTLNALVPLLLWKVVPSVLSKIEILKTPKVTQQVFWVSSISITSLFTLHFIPRMQSYYIRCDIFRHHYISSQKCSQIEIALQRSGTIQKDMKAAFIAKQMIIPLAVLMELVLAIKAWRPNVFPPLPDILCLCCCKASVIKIITKVLQVFMFWQLLIFIQVMAIMVIPCCIMLLVSPLHTLSILSTVAVALLLFTTLLAYLLHICNSFKHLCKLKSANKTHYLKLCLVISFNAIGLILVAGFCMAGFQLYIVMVFAGLANDGINGIVVTLVPTAILTLILWFIKKRFRNAATTKARNSNLRSFPMTSGSNDEEDSEDTEIEII